MAGAVISQLDGARGIPGWRWLLLIEGLVTIAAGFGLYFILPDWPHSARMLTHEQRILAHVRMMHDRNETTPEPEETAVSPLQALASVLKDMRTWFFLVMYMANLVALTITYFIPTMLKGLGYTSVTAQWMTVPIWSCGAVFQLVWSWTSDKTGDRQWHNCGLLGLAAVASLICIVVQNDTVKYVMMCFLVGGMYTAVPLILNWVSETMPSPERKRSIAIAFVNSFGHVSFIYGSYLWPSSEGPRNLKGFTATTVCLFLGAIIAALLPVNTGYSLVVTDPTTNPALIGLSMGERTGSRVLQWVWSYVVLKVAAEIHVS